MGSKTQETTSETETKPSPEAMRHYLNVLDQAEIMASTPLAKGAISPFATAKEVVPAYYVAGQFFGRGGRARYANGGETDSSLNQTKNVKNLKNEVAPLAKQQRKGIKQLGTVQNKQVLKANRQATNLLKQATQQANQLKTAGQAEYDRAKQLAEQAAQVDAGEIQQYYDPYQQAVIDATMKEANQADSLEQARLKAQAVGRGAFGGGGFDLSRALLGGQQSDARNKTLADLQSAGYSQALGAAQNEANRQAQIAAMYGQLGGQQYGQTLQTGQQYGNLANMQAGLGNTIMDQRTKQAQANIAGGSILQAQQQAKKNAEYNKRLQQAQYPYNTLSQYGSLAGGLGSLMGGTTSGTQTTSQPSNIFGQILGGLGTLGSFMRNGGRVGYEVGGSVFDPVQPRTSPAPLPIAGLDMMGADAEGYADGGDVASRIDSVFGIGGPLGGLIDPRSGYDPEMIFAPEVIGELTGARPDLASLAPPDLSGIAVTSGFGNGPFAFRRGEGLMTPEYAAETAPKPVEPIAGFGVIPSSAPPQSMDTAPEITVTKPAAGLVGAGIAGGGPNPIMAGNRILPFTPEQAAQARSIGSPFEMFGAPETEVASAPQAGLAPMASLSGSSAPAGGPSSATFEGVAPWLASKLQADFGLTPEQSAGFVGSLAHETGGFETLQETNPVVPGSRGGFGWSQWTGPRRRQFEAWSAERGLDPRSRDANYGFLKHELTSTPEGRVLADLRQAPDAATAARIVTDQFLRPGVPAHASRQRWTQRALAYSNPNAVPPASGEPVAGLQVASSQPMIDDAEPAPVAPVAGLGAPPAAPRGRSMSDRFREDAWRMPLLVAGLSMLGGGNPGEAIAAGAQAFMAGNHARDEAEAEAQRADVVRRWAARQGLDADTAELMVQNKDIVEAYAKDKLIPKEPDKGEITEIGGRKYRIMTDNTMIDLGPAKAPEEAPRPMTEAERAEWGIPREDKRPYGFVDGKPTVIGGGGQTITIGGTEKEQSKKVGAGLGEEQNSMISEGRKAQDALTSLSILENQINKPDFYSGWGADAVLAGKRILATLGGDPEAAAAAETFNSEVKRAALANMGGSLGSGFSNADRDFVLEQVPNLQNTPEGNKRLIEINRKIAQRKIETAARARAYADTHDGLIDYGFYDDMDKWAAENPVFPSEKPEVRPRATNPKTGEIVEWDGEQWLPVQ